MASALTHLDAYCERAGQMGLMAEPVNAITNLFFIAGALVAFYLIARLPPDKSDNRFDLWLLALLLLAIGIGSGLWHTMPGPTTLLLDVIPITLFIHVYLIAAMRRILGFVWLRILVWWLLYVLLSIAAQITLPPGLLNGTVMYLPTYITLLVLTGAVTTRSLYLGRVFGAMTLVWTVSLILRTYDLQWCKSFGTGTHFLWHTLNALMLYRLLVALIRYRGRDAVTNRLRALFEKI